jgi:hypothetical protein
MPSNAQILSSSEGISRYVTTRAAGEVTFRANEARSRDEERWNATVDMLLAWFREAQADADRHTQACIETALDFVNDFQSDLSVPTSIGLTGDGGVAFDWGSDDDILTIEVLGSGSAELTQFRKGHVVSEERLERNPRTRRLELRDPRGG